MEGEAYAESDEEDLVIDNEGPDTSIVKEAGNKNDVSHDAFPQAKPNSQPRSLSGIDLKNRVDGLEKEEHAALVLVDHRKKIEEDVLKEQGVELENVSKRKPIKFDNRSYKKGIEDAKEIDINQRAIRDEVKVKVEKS